MVEQLIVFCFAAIFVASAFLIVRFGKIARLEFADGGFHAPGLRSACFLLLLGVGLALNAGVRGYDGLIEHGRFIGSFPQALLASLLCMWLAALGLHWQASAQRPAQRWIHGLLILIIGIVVLSGSWPPLP